MAAEAVELLGQLRPVRGQVLVRQDLPRGRAQIRDEIVDLSRAEEPAIGRHAKGRRLDLSPVVGVFALATGSAVRDVFAEVLDLLHVHHLGLLGERRDAPFLAPGVARSPVAPRAVAAEATELGGQALTPCGRAVLEREHDRADARVAEPRCLDYGQDDECPSDQAAEHPRLATASHRRAVPCRARRRSRRPERFRTFGATHDRGPPSSGAVRDCSSPINDCSPTGGNQGTFQRRQSRLRAQEDRGARRSLAIFPTSRVRRCARRALALVLPVGLFREEACELRACRLSGVGRRVRRGRRAEVVTEVALLLVRQRSAVGSRQSFATPGA